jgi:hypothetical protein
MTVLSLEFLRSCSQTTFKVVEGISSACEAWFKNPEPSQFERLAELFKILRTHVGARR